MSDSSSSQSRGLNALLPIITLSERSSKLEYKGWYERIMNYLLCSNLERTVEQEFDEGEMKASRLSLVPSPDKKKKIKEVNKENAEVVVAEKVSKQQSLLAYAVIISRLDNDLINQFSTIERGNAYALMQAIKNKFNVVNFLSRLKARRDFNLISMNRNESVSAYGARIKCAAHEIELGDDSIKIGELELIGRFLDGLPKNYDDLITGLIQGIENISFDQFAEIIQTKSAFINRRDDESKSSNMNEANKAFYSNRPLICYKCGKPGHKANNCPKPDRESNIDQEKEEEEEFKKSSMKNHQNPQRKAANLSLF